MSYYWRGRSPRDINPQYGRNADRPRTRDRDGRLLIRIFKTRKQEGPKSFWGWVVSFPTSRLLAKLGEATQSCDSSVRKNSLDALSYLTCEAEMSSDDVSEAELKLIARYRDADHSETRAINWQLQNARRRNE